MEKIKAVLKNIWAVVVLVLAAVIGIMLYLLKGKQREINSLRAQIDLVETQKQADLLEVEIKKRLDNVNLLDKEIKELNNTLSLLEQKRKQISSEEKNKTSDQIEDFWKNN
jgi:septal ring factor EnvC (AmiA/AmiB activator)